MNAGAPSAPRLPVRTTAQLIAAVNSPGVPAFTGVVQETAALGLPGLPDSANPLSPASLASGSHTLRVWYDGPARVRIAVPVPVGEADLRRDGRDLWLWDSRTNQATHYVLPAASATPVVPAIPAPQQLARQILAQAGATTTVRLQQNVIVAGRAAYQLVLAPKDSRSLVGQVRIAIDARYSLPLQVQVFARGAASPAFSVGYTSLLFGPPAASNFTFSPPPGAKVKTIRVAAPPGVAASGTPPGGMPGSVSVDVGVTGAPSTVVPGGRVPAAVARRLAALARHLPASLSKAERVALLKAIQARMAAGPHAQGGWAGYAPLNSVSSAQSWQVVSGSSATAVGIVTAGIPPAGPTVLGSGWLSVAVLPGGGAVAGAVGSVAGPLLAAATPVHGPWGSGRLLRTTLLTVLLTDGGDVLVGAVEPSVLYADVAQLR